MVAGAFNLHRLAIEEKSFVGIPFDIAHTEGDALGVARLSARLNGCDRSVEIRRFNRPESRIRQIRIRSEGCCTVGRYGLLRRVNRSNYFATGILHLPANPATF